jgi:hypothetical protein
MLQNQMLTTENTAPLNTYINKKKQFSLVNYIYSMLKVCNGDVTVWVCMPPFITHSHRPSTMRTSA